MRPTTQLLGAVSSVALVAMSSAPALAAGTTAGDTITNNVFVTYDVGGVTQDVESASDTFTVDQRVDVTVTAVGGSTSVAPGQQNAELVFDVTNLSNSDVDLELSTALVSATPGNIANFEIFLDADGNGSLDAGEISVGPITFLDEVTEDETVRVIVVADIDLAAVDGESFDVTLTANAFEAGTGGTLGDGTAGSELTDTAGANTAGIDTVLADGSGATDAANQGDFSATNSYVVAAADVIVAKTSRVISDPINNTLNGSGVDPNAKAIPGATIEYCITVANGASAATATNVNVNDLLPADVTFDATFGIFVNGNASCAGGSDGVPGGDASFSAGSGPGGEDEVDGVLTDIPGGTTRSLYFRVTIN